jgi:hypothetical protein
MSTSLQLPLGGDKVGPRPAQIAAVTIAATRRSGHGETAWSLRSNPGRLFQPQDGTADNRSRLATLRPRPQVGVLQEPEDATLTGGTRSLTRRLLGLNVASKRMVSPLVAGSAPRAKVA